MAMCCTRFRRGGLDGVSHFADCRVRTSGENLRLRQEQAEAV